MGAIKYHRNDIKPMPPPLRPSEAMIYLNNAAALYRGRQIAVEIHTT